MADHVKYMTYAVMTDDCSKPERGLATTDITRERETILQIKKNTVKEISAKLNILNVAEPLRTLV